MSMTGSQTPPATAAFSLTVLIRLAIATRVVASPVRSASLVVSFSGTIILHGITLFSSLKRVSGTLVDLQRFTFSQARTASAKVLKTICVVVKVTPTPIPDSVLFPAQLKSEPQLLEEGLLAQEETFSSPQTHEQFDLPLYSSVLVDNTNAAASTASCAAVSACPPFSSNVVASPTDDGNKITSNRLGLAPALSINLTAATDADTAGQSTVVLAALPNPPGSGVLTDQVEPDVFAKIASTLAAPLCHTLPFRKNSLLVLSPFPPPATTSPSDAISSATLPSNSNSSSKVTATTPGSVQIDLPSRFGREAPRDAMRFARARTTLLVPPQIVINGGFLDSSLSLPDSPNADPSTTASLAPSTSTRQTPLTTPGSSVPDLKSDVEGKIGAGTPNPIPSSTTVKLGSVKTRLQNAIKAVEPSEVVERGYDWKWAKREGKRPAPPPPHSDETDSKEEEDVDEEGFSKKEQEKAMADLPSLYPRRLLLPKQKSFLA
ncbi:hypothetical protein FRC01_000698 [Tulasnella sp. 417]|nr:hypothetical protein FRC01_000698 [Tulasnella sp. 417]